MQFLKREREVWKSPCCHPLLSTNKNISLLQNLCFLHPLVLLYVLFIVHLFVLPPKRLTFLWQLQNILDIVMHFLRQRQFSKFPLMACFCWGLFVASSICENWGERGKRPRPRFSALSSTSVTDPLCGHMWKLFFRKLSVFQIWVRGGDVFAFLGQILANCEHSGESESLDPFREVIAHFPKIPDTFCQNYPIPDHLNWACDMLKIYLRLLHVSNENKDKWTDVSQIFLNPCDVGRNDFYLSNRFRATYDFLCNTSLSPSCCNVMLTTSQANQNPSSLLTSRWTVDSIDFSPGDPHKQYVAENSKRAIFGPCKNTKLNVRQGLKDQSIPTCILIRSIKDVL